jgi:hypothetical protein
MLSPRRGAPSRRAGASGVFRVKRSRALREHKERTTMTIKTKGRHAALAMAAAIALGVTGGAWAQASSAGTSDTSSAGNTNGGGLPQIEQQGSVSYTSGGVGLDESKALLREQAQWPLSLRFTGPTADYLSGVHVRIVDAKNAEVLNAVAMGPYMLVKLPAGSYTVYAKYKDQEQKHAVSVAGAGKAKAAFHWSIQ